MNEKELNQFFLSFKGSILTYPFDDITKVYKVKDKMFGLINEVNDIFRVNLKGLPEDNITLRGMFESIKPGYHMNKTHWNSLYLDGSLNNDLIKRLIDESYNIVVSKLTRNSRKELNNLIDKLED